MPVSAENWATDRPRARRWPGLLAVGEVRWAALATVAFLGALAGRALGAPAELAWVLFAICYLSGGWQPGLSGVRALREKVLDVDLLMIVAALVAVGIGQQLDGALLIVIFATSGALEAVATKRTRDSVRSLLSLAPEQATRLGPDDDEEVVDAAALVVGDLVLVRPGERVGADGLVVGGMSEVDQATITGEPLPVIKDVGAEVFAGTLNGAGVLRVRVLRAAGDSVVARIVAMVDEASATKAKTQLFIERVEQRYSVAMVTATLGLFLVPLALGAALQPTLLRAMTFMIVASPCAVVLATMPPLLSAIANAGRHGVLVKSAVVMEQIARTTTVCFDKTGTLTEGTPWVAAIHLVAGSGMDEATLLQLAAGAERLSEHPLARAIVAAATEAGLQLPQVQTFSALPGEGVEAQILGRRVEVLRPTALHSAMLLGLVGEAVAALESTGHTAVVVSVEGKAAGVLGLTDRLRQGATGCVAALAAVTGKPPVLLTGDNARAARLLATIAGISDVRAGLLPEDKMAVVRELQGGGASVTVVGDGVNDAPALAAADIGVAMGRSGSDLAMSSADAVVIRDDLATLPAVIGLARHAKRVVVQNLVLAVITITVLVVIDLVGKLPLPLGVAGHEGSTVIVGLNGLRLLSARAWRSAAA